MPFLHDPAKEEEDQKAQGGGAPANQTIVGATAPASVGNSPKAAAGGASPASGTPTRSGSWTNLQQYVTANQGQDKQLGQRAAATVENRVADANARRQNLAQQAQSAVTAGSPTSTVANQLRTDPTKVTRQQYEQASTATYTGPRALSEIQGYDEAEKAQRKSTQLADNLTAGNHTNRTAALNEIAGRPGYSMGERNLDGFLLGAGLGGQEQLAAIKPHGTGGVGHVAWDGLAKSVGAQIGAAQTNAKNLAADTKSAYGDVLAGTTGRLDAAQRTAGDLSAANAAYEKSLLAGDWRTWNLNENQVDDLTRLGVDWDKMLDRGQGTRLGDLVDPNDQAAYEALMRLSGDEGGYDFSTTEGRRSTTINPNQVADAMQAVELDRLMSEYGSSYSKPLATAMEAAKADPLGYLLKNRMITETDLDQIRQSGAATDPASWLTFEDTSNASLYGDKALTRWKDLATRLGLDKSVDPAAVAYTTPKVNAARLAELRRGRDPLPVASTTPASAGAGGVPFEGWLFDKMSRAQIKKFLGG